MPLYDGDLEQSEGLPQNVQRLKKLMSSQQGFLISAPEYNSSITGVLKNTMDWTSRQSENEAPLACYTGKVAGIMSASPGGLGGLRGLVHVRVILENMGVMVIPEQIAVSAAHEAFDVDNSLKDKRQEEKVKKIGANLTRILAKLSN